MKRHNPASSSLPNAQIDLTPLMDCIFILLFTVIIGYISVSNNPNITDAEVQELTDTVAEQNQTIFELETKIDAEKTESNEYEQIIDGVGIRIVTIYCRYDEEKADYRNLYVLAPQSEVLLNTNIEANNSKIRFNSLKNALQKYIEESIKDDPDCLIILHVNEENILYRDWNSIKTITNEIRDKYDSNVY